jgi:hypothetical protein
MHGTYRSEYIFLDPEIIILTQNVPYTFYAKLKFTILQDLSFAIVQYTYIPKKVLSLKVFLQRFLEHFKIYIFYFLLGLVIGAGSSSGFVMTGTEGSGSEINHSGLPSTLLSSQPLIQVIPISPRQYGPSPSSLKDPFSSVG